MLLIQTFILIKQIKQWGKATFPIHPTLLFVLLAINLSNAQNIATPYTKLSYTIGFENVQGFAMEPLPFGLQYAHVEQTAPSLSINYDLFRWYNSFLRTRFRVLRIVEKEYILLSQQYTNAPNGDFISYITTSSGTGDLRFEFVLGYDYDVLNRKTFSLFLGTEGMVGLGQDTYPSILEIGFEPNNTQLNANQSSPNTMYFKLGTEAGIKLTNPYFLARVNFFYHYRLQNLLEGRLVINNSNNQFLERDYTLKGDSYGVSLTVYPKKRKTSQKPPALM